MLGASVSLGAASDRCFSLMLRLLQPSPPLCTSAVVLVAAVVVVCVADGVVTCYCQLFCHTTNSCRVTPNDALANKIIIKKKRLLNIPTNWMLVHVT